MLFPLECWCSFGKGDSGDSYIEMEVTEEEYARLEAARQSGKEFCDCAEVADLYDRAYELADEDATGNLIMADILEKGERASDIYSIGVCFERLEDDEYDEYDEDDEDDEDEEE